MRKVQLHEFNILMEKKVYLPNVSGMLQAYATTLPEISRNYSFSPFLFVREEPEKISLKWNDLDVLAFSSSMWNHELNLKLAQMARELFPNSLIIFGGPHISNRDGETEKFLEAFPFIDLVVLSEGEVTFAEVLKAFSEGRNFSGVEGLVFKDRWTGQIVRTPRRPYVDVNLLPSPYLLGLYDEILAGRGEIEYQMILETNRGCPFHCTFCGWGNCISKVRFFDLSRLKREIEWLSDHKISYVFGADANFGMFSRDKEIVRILASVKKQRDYPKSFRVCFGKNATDRIYEVASMLEANRLSKGVTISFQSTDPDTLKIIRRDNIKTEYYRELLRRYRKDRITVYTELILGLPGETYETFARGIEEVFQAGLYDQVGIFFCQVLPNTEMSDPEYVAAHGVETKHIELSEVHASKRKPNEVTEHEEIIVATNSMPLSDWRKAATLGWVAQTLHGLKLGFFVSLYLFDRFGIKYTEFFEYLISRLGEEQFPVFKKENDLFSSYLDGIMQGCPQCVFFPEYGDISWQVEEATFLRLSESPDDFYREFEKLVKDFIEDKNIELEEDQLEEVFLYQSARVANYQAKTSEFSFSWNIPEYFERLILDLPGVIARRSQTLSVERVDYHGNREEFAKQVIWYGRRDCRAIEPATWR